MEASPSDLVILDEADHLIFNHTDLVKKVAAKHRVIAFTATISKSNFETAEVGVVKMLGFLIL